ncbi:MAG: hypothetical protein AAB922_06900 [Patescibacteria group bacterium]
MKFISETEKSWLAGFIDGEGYIGIVRAKKRATRQRSDSLLYQPWIIITSTDIKVLEDIQLVVRTQKRASLRPTEGRKIGYQIKINKFDDVVDFLEAVRPYLRVKQKQAELLVKYCRLRKKVKIITGRGSRGQSSFGKNEEIIYLKLRKLNKRGI